MPFQQIDCFVKQLRTATVRPVTDFSLDELLIFRRDLAGHELDPREILPQFSVPRPACSGKYDITRVNNTGVRTTYG